MNYQEIQHRLKHFDHVEGDAVEQFKLLEAMRTLPGRVVVQLVKTYVPEHLQDKWFIRLLPE